MKFKVGDICKVNPYVCRTYDSHDNARYIRIKEVVNNLHYRYEILDKDKNCVTYCSYCLNDNDLVLASGKKGRPAKVKPAQFFAAGQEFSDKKSLVKFLKENTTDKVVEIKREYEVVRTTQIRLKKI